MLYLLVLVPLAMAALTFAWPADRSRPWLLPAGALVQLALAMTAIFGAGEAPLAAVGGWLSVLFFLCSLYAPGYLALRPDRPNRVLCANLFAGQAMMVLVTLSHHL